MNKELSLKDFLLKLHHYFPKSTVSIKSTGNRLMGIGFDFTKLETLQNINSEAFLFFFNGLKQNFDDLYELKILFSSQGFCENIFEIFDLSFHKLHFLRKLNLKFWFKFGFLTKDSIQIFCSGLRNLKSLKEINLDFSGMNFYYENLALIGKELNLLPDLTEIGFILNKTNTTIEMLCCMNSKLLAKKKMLNFFSLGFNNNNLRETGLKKLLKNIKISFPELKVLCLDFSFNNLRKESFIYCLRKCLKKKWCEKLENLSLNFMNNEIKSKNYLTIETSQEIFKQEIDKITIEKYFKALKCVKVDLKNNGFFIEDYLQFTNFFQYLTKTERLKLDFSQNNRIYDGILLVKLLEKMFTINNTLKELSIKFEKLDLYEIGDYNSLPRFENLKSFTFQTKNVTFGKKKLGITINSLCFILKKMPYIKCLNIMIPFYEYNHNFFDNFLNVLPQFDRLKYLSLELNYIYLFKSQCEMLVTALKTMKNLKHLELIVRLKCDFIKEYENLEEGDFENVIFIYENLPSIVISLQNLLFLRINCLVNNEEKLNVLDLMQAKEIYLRCLQNKKSFTLIDMGNLELTRIIKKKIERFFLICKNLENKIKNVFKRKLIRNEILEFFL